MTDKIFFHPHNSVHETIIGCAFAGAIVTLMILAEVYRRQFINRQVIGPTDEASVEADKRLRPDIYGADCIRWWHQQATKLEAGKCLTDSVEEANSSGSLPAWVTEKQNSRLQINSVGSALTDEMEISPATLNSSEPTSAKVRFVDTPVYRANEARERAEPWPLPGGDAERPAIRKLSRKSEPDEHGRRNKKSVVPGELSSIFWGRNSITRSKSNEEPALPCSVPGGSLAGPEA